MSNQSRRRSKKVRSQTDVSRRRQSAVPDIQPERRRRHKSYDADDEEATTGRLRVAFTRESRRYSDSESDRYESCDDDDDDDEYVSESDYGQSISDDDDAIDNDWSPWITLAKRTNNALAAGGVVAVTPTTNSAQGNAMTETKKPVVGEVKRSKKGGFFRRLFGGDKKEKDVGNKKGGPGWDDRRTTAAEVSVAAQAKGTGNRSRVASESDRGSRERHPTRGRLPRRRRGESTRSRTRDLEVGRQ